MSKKVKSGIVLAVAGLATSFALVAPAEPAAAAPVSCSISLTYEVDGWTGNVILYPRARCNGELQTLAISGTSPDTGEGNSMLYTNTSPGTYAGYGVAVPNRGHDTYCLGISVVWTLPLTGFANDVSGSGCVQT